MLCRITHIQPSQRTALNSHLQADLKFKPGEILKGTVIQKFPGGEVLIAAKGKLFRAYTELNLMEGNKHNFQVKTVGPKIELKVLDGMIHKLGSPIQIWSSNRVARAGLASILLELSKAHNLSGLSRGLSQALKNLNQLFPSIVYNNQGDDSSLWASRSLLGSGLLWENKIVRYLLGKKNMPLKRLTASDLKGLLLSIGKIFSSEKQDHDHLRPLAVKIRQALFLIEQDQLLNVSSLREGLGWFWFISGLEEDGFRNAELFVKENESGDEIHFSMFLEFTRLGKMEVDASIIESVLGVKIRVEDTEKANFVTEHLPILEKGLQNTSLVTGSIVCDVKESQDLDFNPFPGGGMPSPSVHIVI
ncbi:MAG: hypothetical protein JRC68_06130 [Deltaproteobacteria bacterium]|nr:hypothetical protein [Deltaproteobacteria bacterium]